MAAIVLSVIGAIAGVGGFVVALSALQEERDVDVELFAYANPRDDTVDGFGVRATFVNQGLRPVIVQQMRLDMGDSSLAPASAYLKDSRDLDLLPVAPERVGTQRQPLPITLPARSARTFAVLFELGAGVATGQAANRALDRTRRFCRLVARGGLDEPLPGITIVADIQPGGQTLVRPLPRSGAMTLRFDWQVFLPPDQDSPEYVAVRNKIAEPSSASRVQLDLWEEAGSGHVSRDRVVFGAEQQRIPLPQLRSGSYDYALRVGDRVVDAGTFTVPTGRFPATGFEPSRGTLGTCSTVYRRSSNPPAR